jgi:hypothetical protein
VKRELTIRKTIRFLKVFMGLFLSDFQGVGKR